MRGLRRVVKPGGLVIATIRPVEFWASNPVIAESGVSVEEMVRLHEQVGFAHAPAGGGGVWGDTSMTVDYIARRWPEWRIVGAEEVEGHQTGVLLQPTA